MQISFEHDGELGFTMTMTINLGNKNKGLYANLFYYNEETGTLEFMGSSLIGKDGTVDLNFNHFSDYAIVIDKVSLAPEDVSAGAGTEVDETLIGSDTDNRKNVIAVLLLIPNILFAVIVKRRKISK
jgi:hypothetical protein